MNKVAETLGQVCAVQNGVEIVPADGDAARLHLLLATAPDLAPVRQFVMARATGAYGFPLRPDAAKAVKEFEAAHETTPTMALAREAAVKCARYMRDDRLRVLRETVTASQTFTDLGITAAEGEQLFRALNDVSAGRVIPLALTTSISRRVGAGAVTLATERYFRGMQAAQEIQRLEALNASERTDAELSELSDADRAAKVKRFEELTREAEKAAADVALARTQAGQAEAVLKRVEGERRGAVLATA